MRRILLIILAFALLSASVVVGTASAQEFRGSLTGQVTDPTGAAIPNAQVAVMSTATGATSHTVTGSQGFYSVPFLAPGEYQISVDASGFKKYTQTGINVLTAETMTVNVHIAIGNASTSVTVHADAELLDTGDASTEEVMTADELEDLPSSGRTPLGFARDAYGAIPKMKHATVAATPFQGSTADDFSLGGGLSSSNELLLNGVPNMQDSSRTALFSPQMDSVSTVRVDEFNANASMGDTSGGTIDITTKAGGNEYHGAASEFYQGTTVGGAKPFLTAPGAAVTNTHYNQFGGAVGGPVWIPKIFNGRNRLFFEYAYEGYIGETPPTPTVSEVPTCAERGQNGPASGSLFCSDNSAGTPDYPDFSALLAANAAYQLYDPFSSTGTGATFARAKIPNNQFANATNAAGGTGIALDPIARNLLQYIPAPNTTATATATGENNYTTYSPNPANYRSHSLRLDYNISQSNKIFGEAHRGKYLTSGSDYFHDLATGTITDQIYSGGVVDDVQTFTPTLNLDSRAGFSRYQNVNAVKSSGISPTKFGFPAYIAANSTALAMPRINFADSVSPVSIGVVPGSLEFQDTIQLFEMLTKVRGRHTYKAGIDIRAQKQSNLSPGDADGLFTFTSNTGTNNPIAVNDNSNANTTLFGGAFALFDMGITTGAGTENINQAYQYNNWYQAYFIQDDWKAAPNLTVSIGLRMEHETPEVESQNRTVTGWNPTATNAMTAAAAAAYGPALTADVGSTSLPYLPSSINPTGGAVYATSSNRSAYQTAPIYLSPRLGVSWAPDALHEKTVFRVGIGVYNNPFDDYSGSSANTGQTYGFSATSSVVQNGTVTSNTQTPWTTIDDPFPTCTTCAIPASPIVSVTGSAYGTNQNLDQAMVFDAHVKVPYTERVSADVQHQFGNNWMIEAGYILTHGIHTTYNNALSSVPILPFLNRGLYNNTALSSALTSTGTGFGIANPFKGLGAPYTNSQGMLTASRITAEQALSPWPEYTGVTEDLIPGASTEFNALNARLQKRMSYGLDMNITFTYSKLLAIAQNNPGGPLNYQENSSDFPLKLNAQVIYDLPFGIGRQWMNHSKILDEGLGGWEISTIYGYLSGAVLSWSTNSVYQGNGSWKDFANHPHNYSTKVPSFNIASIYNVTTNAAAIGTTPAYSAGAPGSTNYRYFPQNLLRQDHENNWDFSMFKGFRAGDWALLQLRIDAFNAFNRPQFAAANTSPGSTSFGLANSVQNSARQLQGGLHLVF